MSPPIPPHCVGDMSERLVAQKKRASSSPRSPRARPVRSAARRARRKSHDRPRCRRYVPDPRDPAALARDAHAYFARGFCHVDRADALEHLLELVCLDLLDALWHLVLPFLDWLRWACPGVRLGTRKSDRRARSDNARPFKRGPGARLTNGLATREMSASRACPTPFSRLQGAPARGHGD